MTASPATAAQHQGATVGESVAFDPVRTLRELLNGIDAVLPYVHLPRDASVADGLALPRVREAQASARRLLRLPWIGLLEASSTHLDPSERSALADGAPPDPFLLVMACDHGWLLHTTSSGSLLSPLGPGLAALFALAKRARIAYVRIDDDAAVVPGMAVLS
ncbi:hypothetical protein [Rhodanobacter sp. FW106-PBR-R2A-1-13]|uniref:DUF5983 family protein n=1 Tax=Rhodanobacter sp. FW106-PBR-R2A-1-13 TaxID=3454845 RepID=UPI0034E457B9